MIEKSPPQALTAAAIVKSWNRVHPVLGKLSAWIVLLRIAATEADGITLSELREKTNTDLTRKGLRRWATAGLIEIIQTGPSRGPGCPHYIRYCITPKGTRFLGLPPV